MEYRPGVFSYGEMIDTSGDGWFTTDGGLTYGFYKAYLSLTITDTSDPTWNWDLENRLNPDGTIGSYTLIAQRSLGDWNLPSIDELGEMYTVLYLQGVGGFSGVRYWSSSESSATLAFNANFATGALNSSSSKASTYAVRASRTFVDDTNTYLTGDTGPGGGLIYIVSGNTYYEAAPSDESAAQAWSNVSSTELGTTEVSIGTGGDNTLEIIGQAGHTDSAAKLCNDLN
jgi:hypothetical protein